MIFEQLLFQAKEGDLESITDILNMYQMCIRDRDYAMYLRCRGLREGRILLFHAYPHAVVDLLPSFAQMLGLCPVSYTLLAEFLLCGLVPSPWNTL